MSYAGPVRVGVGTLLLLATLASSGCNTVRGVGQDVEAAGSTLSTTAEETKEKM